MEPPVFPFRTVFSLHRLVRLWRQAALDREAPWRPFAEAVLAGLQDAPDLAAPEVTREALERHRDVVDLMMSAVFPRAQWDDQIGAILGPFATDVFYTTPTCRRLGLLDVEVLHERMQLGRDAYEYGRTMLAYYHILERCYGVEVGYEYPLILHLDDDATGLERYYHLQLDPRFAELEVAETPLLRDADLARLIANPTDRALWETLLPPERFTWRGFGIATVSDVTGQQVVSAIKDDLLQKGAMTSPESVTALQRHLRALLGCPDLEFGLICLERGKMEQCDLCGDVPTVRALGRSLLLDAGDVATISCAIDESVYGRALAADCGAVAVSDLSTWPEQTEWEQRLLAQGYRSLAVTALRVGGEVVGLLELASPNAGALNAFNVLRVDEVQGQFATALRRSLDEREDHIQAIIKAQCTAIHPVVEWRFREAAAKHLETPAAERPRQMEPIVFHDVMPLYGLTDVRGSSAHRSAAIAADLTEQLSQALAIVVEAAAYRPLPVLDELGYRIEQTIADIEAGLRAEHEAGVLDFLRTDVEALFDHLQTYGPNVRERIDRYHALLDPHLGVLYRDRKRYEDSINHLNEAISAYVEAQEEQAQALVPHYFEKYKSDGVEHNIYVGASLLEQGRTLDPLALRNLRLWQLMTLCGTAWTLNQLAPELPMRLEATHLVLVHDAPLSIRFRYDEKHFDVDGAYNTRYEIVKKRIDKAYVARTEERLTQPGYLAIVFALAQQRVAAEYRAYLDYLQAAGYLSGPGEEVELEPLQGAYGLRAFRAPIAPEPPGLELSVLPAQAGALTARLR